MACIRRSWAVVGGTGAGLPGGVSASSKGMAGSLLMVTAWGNLAPRSGFSSLRLENFLRRIWEGRMDRYSDERAEVLATGEARAKVEMSYIGG